MPFLHYGSACFIAFRYFIVSPLSEDDDSSVYLPLTNLSVQNALRRAALSLAPFFDFCFDFFRFNGKNWFKKLNAELMNGTGAMRMATRYTLRIEYTYNAHTVSYALCALCIPHGIS